MRLCAFFIVLIVVIPNFKHASGFSYLSSRRDGGSFTDQLEDISFHSNLGVVSTGYFSGTSNFGGANLTSSGSQRDVFLAKYDANLTHVWSKSFGYSGPDESDAVSVDDNNNIFIAGSFHSSINFGGANLTGCSSTSCSSLFLVKFDSNGNLLWNQQYPMNAAYSSGQAPGLAISSDGSILLGGQFIPAITFGSKTYDFLGGTDVFLAKLDSSGNPQWSLVMQGSSNEILYDVAWDSSGNPVAVAVFNSPVTLQGNSIAWNGSTDAIVAKFNSTGSLLWYLTVGTSSSDKFLATAVDSLGNIYAGGQCGDNFIIGSIFVLCNNTQPDLTLIKISPDGTPLWAFAYGSSNVESIVDIALSSDNSVLITGFYNEAISLGGNLLVSDSAGLSSFIAKYTPNGTHIWSGTASTASALRLLYDTTSGRIAIGDSFSTKNVTIEGGPVLKNAGSADVYIATFVEYAPSASPSPPPSSGASMIGFSYRLMAVLCILGF